MFSSTTRWAMAATSVAMPRMRSRSLMNFVHSFTAFNSNVFEASFMAPPILVVVQYTACWFLIQGIEYQKSRNRLRRTPGRPELLLLSCFPFNPFVRSIVNRLFLFLFLTISFAGVSCERQSSYKPTEEDKRILRTYASLALLYDSFPATVAPDSLALYDLKIDSVLRQSGFTRDEFRRECEDLLNSPERFQPLYKELSAEIQKEMRR